MTRRPALLLLPAAGLAALLAAAPAADVPAEDLPKPGAALVPEAPAPHEVIRVKLEDGSEVILHHVAIVRAYDGWLLTGRTPVGSTLLNDRALPTAVRIPYRRVMSMISYDTAALRASIGLTNPPADEVRYESFPPDKPVQDAVEIEIDLGDE